MSFSIFKNTEPVTTRYQLEGYIKCPDLGDTFAYKDQTLLLFLVRDSPINCKQKYVNPFKGNIFQVE